MQDDIVAVTLAEAIRRRAARADEGFVWRYDAASRSVKPQMVKLGEVTVLDADGKPVAR